MHRFFIALAALAAIPAIAQDWARIRTGAESTIFFKIAAPLDSYGGAGVLAAAEKAAALHVKNAELGTASLPPTVSADQLAAIKAGWRRSGMKLAAYSAGTISAGAFQVAKELGVETLIGSVPADMLATVDQLATESNINVALTGNPRDLRKTLDGRSSKVGACVDLDLWTAARIPPSEGLSLIDNRVVAVRIGKTGVDEMKEFFLEAFRRGIKPTIVTMAPGSAAGLEARLIDYEAALTPVMTEYVNQLGRTTPIRTLDTHTRLDETAKAEARRRMDAAMPAKPQAAPRKPRKLLVIDLQVGYPGHPSIPYANYFVEQFGKRTGAWEATLSNDLANFQYARLKQFDAIFLNNTVGMIFPDPDVRASILRFLREGGGLAGYHAATHASIDWRELTEIIGASSGAHREQHEAVTVRLDDPASPVNAVFDEQEFVSVDEHFRWTDFSRSRVHTLLSFDVAKTDMNQGRGCNICTRDDNDYPISWIRSYGRGRIFYTSLGHNPDVFWNPKIAGQILAGLQFALGDLDADTTPGNLPKDFKGEPK